MSDSLSQEEIDKLMHGNGNDQTTSSKEEAATAAQKPEATGKENAQSATAQTNLKDEKTKQEIIGEVGNISMSQAATTLSSILNHRVTITTPHVTKVYFKELIAGIATPKVAMTVAF